MKEQSSDRKKRRVPERTCIACKNKKPQHELLRVVLDPNNIAHVDYLNKLPGRGAYVCPTLHCIEKAARQGSFAKAFKQAITIHPEDLIEEARLAANQQIRSLLSLANRAHVVSAGHSRVERTLKEEKAHLLIIAEDASDTVKHKFQKWGKRNGLPTYLILTQLELAPAVGYPTCSLLTINDLGFAQKLENEIYRAHQLNFSQHAALQSQREKRKNKRKKNRTDDKNSRSRTKKSSSFSKSIP